MQVTFCMLFGAVFRLQRHAKNVAGRCQDLHNLTHGFSIGGAIGRAIPRQIVSKSPVVFTKRFLVKSSKKVCFDCFDCFESLKPGWTGIDWDGLG